MIKGKAKMKIQFKKLAVALIAAMVVSGGMVFGADEIGKKPSDYLTLKPDSNPKTGGFVGGELGLTGFDWYNQSGYAMGINQNGNREYGYFSATSIDNPPAPGFAINIVGGYQWYFYNKPYFHLGVRAKGWLGYGYKKSKDKNNYENYYNIVRHIFNFGSDLAFLWDFVNSDKHSFGVHFAPIGFNVTADSETSQLYKGPNYDTGSRTNINTTDTYPSYTINLGLHYYYDVNHQVFVDYRYFANSFEANPNDISYRLRHQFTLGYAYKI